MSSKILCSGCWNTGHTEAVCPVRARMMSPIYYPTIMNVPFPDLNTLFLKLIDSKQTLEWSMLVNHYVEHPEAFKVIQHIHESNNDIQPHFTIEVIFMAVRPSQNRIMPMSRKYHIYYRSVNRYDYVTALDRDFKPYTLASFS